MFAQRLDVGDEMPRSVVDEARTRPALARAALIEQHNAITLRIEESAHLGIGAAARSAVQEHHGFSCGVAALLVVELVHWRDTQESRVVRLDGRIEIASLARRRWWFAGGLLFLLSHVCLRKASGRAACRPADACAGGTPPARRDCCS